MLFAWEESVGWQFANGTMLFWMQTLTVKNCRTLQGWMGEHKVAIVRSPLDYDLWLYKTSVQHSAALKKTKDTQEILRHWDNPKKGKQGLPKYRKAPCARNNWINEGTASWTRYDRTWKKLLGMNSSLRIIKRTNKRTWFFTQRITSYKCALHNQWEASKPPRQIAGRQETEESWSCNMFNSTQTQW